MGDKHDELDYPRSERSSRRQQALAEQNLLRIQQQQQQQLQQQQQRRQHATSQAAKKQRKSDDDGTNELRVSIIFHMSLNGFWMVGFILRNSRRTQVRHIGNY